MEEGLSGIFFHGSCAAGINFKNLSEAGLLHLFPTEAERWWKKLQSCLPAELKSCITESRNRSPKISNSPSGERLKGKRCQFVGAQKSLTVQHLWTKFGSTISSEKRLVRRSHFNA